MDVKERLNQIQQAHAQHVQLLQQTQANILKLEGAAEILREVIAVEDATTANAVPSNVVPFNRAQRRRRTKAQMAVDAVTAVKPTEAPPA